jgi:hypothetical protein
MEVEVTVRSQVLEDNGWVEAGVHWYCELVRPAHEVGVKGCPLGRARTKQGAIEDLVRRIGYESKVKIEPVEVERRW